MKYVPPKGPKRGVSLYSYTELIQLGMTLEDCFLEMQDMGAHGVEILGNSHIPGYPNMTDEFVEEWYRLLDKYEIVPAEYGHWIDTRMFRDRPLTVKESVDLLTQDFKIANKLGFHCLRTKMGVIDDILTPVEDWREVIDEASPIAEEYGVIMLPEIHLPTLLEHKMIQDYVEYIDSRNSKAFGLNIDLSVFTDNFDGMFLGPGAELRGSKPEEIIPLLPYVHCIHAKFSRMIPDPDPESKLMFKEYNIPYEKILPILVENGWDGWMVAEYEGRDRGEENALSEAMHQHQILMKNILGY